jgi:citrate lyase subunit beta / citryl-CoA lyase
MQQTDYAQLVIAKDFAVRRSELTCPAHSLKMMAKAAASSADEVIFDLEDACAVSQKVEARKILIEALKTLDFKGKIRAFRPNSVRTKYFYRDVIDVLEAAGANVDVVVIPKVYGAEDVLFADRLITQVEMNSGLPVGRIKLEVLIESAKGLLRAEEIASCSPRMDSLIFGIADYAGDVGARDFTQEQFQTFHYPKAHIIAAARAAGISVIDNVTVQFRDLEQVRRDAEGGARLGFDGKWAIHPSHVDIIHAAYAPSRAELERALAIMEAYRKADVEQGQGAIVFNDEMVDAASLRVEWKKLAVAIKAGLMDAQGHLVG